METEQIAESQLIDVFDAIKGPGGKHRSFINIDDFKATVIKCRPASILEELEESERDAAGQQNFIHLLEDLFRNICESVSPLVDPTAEE